MCGRYYVADEELTLELREVIAEANRRVAGDSLKTSGEFFPGDCATVIANSRSMRPGAFPMTWGFDLGNGKTVINARSETAAQKPMFADGMRQRRCVIPATGYYEWENRGSEKVKYAIRPRDAACTYMAGIYRFEEKGASFVILTRTPADSIAFIHDRMPVLLGKDAISEWLNPQRNAEEVLQLAVCNVRFEAV